MLTLPASNVNVMTRESFVVTVGIISTRPGKDIGCIETRLPKMVHWGLLSINTRLSSELIMILPDMSELLSSPLSFPAGMVRKHEL